MTVKTENAEICKACGGKCCKKMGCHFSPDDFPSISFEHLKKEIDKGYISIDRWEGPLGENGLEEIHFLRMRHILKIHAGILAPIVDYPWSGAQCMLLTEEGCSLEYDKRPKGGRLLVPRASLKGECKQLYTKKECVSDWSVHYDLMNELAEHYCDRS